MPFYECPNCGHNFKRPPKGFGKGHRCPECRKLVHRNKKPVKPGDLRTVTQIDLKGHRVPSYKMRSR